MTLKELPGYLSNTRSVTPECGSIPDSPWKVEVKPGQKINLTLYEFSHDKSTDDNKCRTYAIVRERTMGRTRNITLCTIDRQRHVYTSVTNSLEIGLVNNIPTNFMIKYEGKFSITDQAINTSINKIDGKILKGNCRYTENCKPCIKMSTNYYFNVSLI